MKPLLPIFAAFALSFQAPAADTGFKLHNVVLYQPDEVLQARTRGAEALAEYIHQLGPVCEEFFSKETKPESLDIVVAVKPGKKSRVWFVAPARKELKALAPLKEKLERVPAPEVFEGPIAIALSGDIAGGDRKPKADGEEFSPPIPKEWSDAVKDAKKDVAVPDGFLAKVWPEAPGESPDKKSPPPGFVTQALEPTGGSIFRPKDWHFEAGSIKAGWMWTLAKEDLSRDKGYTTGVRIQFFMGVKEKTGQTPEQFLKDYAAKKKKSANRVVSTREPKDMGLCTRIGLETEEGPHRILYSMFWGNNDLDIAVVTTSGTTKELWEQYAKTFDIMSDFTLLDMKRLEEATRKTGEEEKKGTDNNSSPEK